MTPIITPKEIYNMALSLNHDATMSELRKAKTDITSAYERLKRRHDALEEALRLALSHETACWHGVTCCGECGYCVGTRLLG